MERPQNKSNTKHYSNPESDARMSSDVEQQLTERLCACDYFALKIDESTDVACRAILLVFVRYVRNDDWRAVLI